MSDASRPHSEHELAERIVRTQALVEEHSWKRLARAYLDLEEQYETLCEAVQAVADARSYVSIDGRTVLADESLAERVDALRAVLNPASEQEAR